MGASLGGTQAVQKLLGALSPPFALPIVLVLHRHRDSDARLVDVLQRASALRVVEATDKQPLEPATVYVAPPDYHVLIDGEHLALSVDDPVLYARPSIDVLFESATVHGRRVIAVVLTGGSADGARGSAAIESNGGLILAQSPSEAMSADMPKAAIAATAHAEVLDLDSIASRLLQLARTNGAESK